MNKNKDEFLNEYIEKFFPNEDKKELLQYSELIKKTISFNFFVLKKRVELKQYYFNSLNLKFDDLKSYIENMKHQYSGIC